MEAEEHIQKLNDNILLVEKNYSDPGRNGELKKVLNELMRSSHTIKGSSASMGYVKLAFLTHVMEDVFDNARNDALKLNQSLIDNLFEAIDLIESSVNSIKNTGEEADTDEFSNTLKKITGVATEGIGKSSPDNTKKAEDKKIEKSEEENNEENADAVKINYIKVPVERLETLMDMVEELLIDKMRLEQLAMKHKSVKEVSDHVSLLVSGIQFQVMQARLVPVEQIFARFPRMVRDLAQKQNKKIELKMIGSEIELDRSIIDKLGEPLVHLLRNAVDHGILKQGTIILKAVRESDNALFIVENDEQGIDYEKVREAAVKRNIAEREEIKNYGRDELIELLFHPRLSTRDVVSEISGRGVGLSVVKNFVDMMNGRVTVDDLNPGVRFTLELPLTLAIINSLLVRINDSVFAIPFTNVERSVKFKKENIKKMADRDVGIVDGKDVPLVYFSRLARNDISALQETFKSEVPAGAISEIAGQAEENGEITAVIVKKEDENVGLVVDGLINVQEIIVKPLSPILRKIKGFSGSTILGDGTVILILDVLNLIEHTKL